ncbi:MAG: ABC transporter permease [Bacteroidota bacterium]
MFSNYLIIAWRNLLKYRLFSIINLLGLGLSLAVCLVIINLIYTHYQYDTFHEKGDAIYRITTANEGENGFFAEIYATSPQLLGRELMEIETTVLNCTNLSKDFNLEVESEHKILEMKAFFADDQFFEIFDFPRVAGDLNRALEQPNQMVLKEEKARLLFPDDDALGQVVRWGDFGVYEIAGIVGEPEVGTHLAFDALVSHVTMPSLITKGWLSDLSEWENVWQNYNYLVLSSDRDLDRLHDQIGALTRANMDLEEGHLGYDFDLQALTDIVPGQFMANEISFALPGFVLLFFALLGVVVILTASLNYTNLFIARSVGRLREIGVRKANGAGRGQIVVQFLVESILLMLLSLLFAIVIYRYLLLQFNELSVFNQLGLRLKDLPGVYWIFVVFSLILGLITGVGPSLVLSRVNVVSSLANRLQGMSARAGFFKMGWGRKTLTGIQFGLSIIVLLTVFILQDQAHFFIESEYGFDEDQVFQMALQNHDPDIVKSEFSQIAGVTAASLVSHHPAIGRSYGRDARRAAGDEPITVYYFGVDEEYLDLMGLDLAAGTNFPSTSTDLEKFILLNETATRRLGFESNNAAIGETILYGDSLRLIVAGVLKDYHWEPLITSIRPMALRLKPDEYELAYFRIAASAAGTTRQRFEQAWERFDPARDFEGGYLDEELDKLYLGFVDIRKILSLVGMLAICITALGFLGMVGYDLQTRSKEIGIRKVLGAKLRDLLLSLGRGYFGMLTVVLLIALPIGLTINYGWVGQLAYHAPIDWGNVVPALLIVLGTGIATLLSQIILRSRENPTEALRNE